jgi:hypothetical protein
VSIDLERELRAVFHEASQFMLPRADLVSQVRRATRRRRLALGIVTAAAVVAAGSGYLGAAGGGRHVPPRPVTPRHAVKPRGPLAITTPGGYEALAVGGPVLYVATGSFPDAALSAYDRASGQLIRRIRVPSTPRALRVGPGGLVWLTFYPDQNGGGTGLWLLSPDLGQRSSLNPRTAGSIGLSDVLPVGAADALVAADGLADLHMPVPGQPGQATLHRVSALPTDHGYGGAVEFAPLAGRIAALQEDNIQNLRIVLAGQRGPVFDPGAGVNINSMADGGNGLWITTGNQPTGPSTGAVIRLNDRLQAVTPRSISNNPALAFPEQVRAAGDTVVVTTHDSSQPLVCFSFHNGAGPVTDIPARLPPGDLAMAGDTVYAADASGVIAYRVPPICR